MTEQEKARKAAELLIAWADGKKLEYSTNNKSKWFTYCGSSFPDINTDNFETVRIKPESVKQWYRVGLFRGRELDGSASMHTYTTTIENIDAESEWQNSKYFVKWLTDRIEYEVEV